MLSLKRTKGQNNDLQNTTQKTKDWATRMPLKTGGILGWHPACYSRYKPDDKSWMLKGRNCDYDKQNISVVICDTDIPSAGFTILGVPDLGQMRPCAS
jgi:hypothetical protein